MTLLEDSFPGLYHGFCFFLKNKGSYPRKKQECHGREEHMGSIKIDSVAKPLLIKHS